jgi:hypothetical protein
MSEPTQSDTNSGAELCEPLIAAEPILQFFAFEHLPEHLREVSHHFAALAFMLVRKYPRNPERTVALRKLLEAKDATVRAVIYRSAPARPDLEAIRDESAQVLKRVQAEQERAA